MMQASGHIVIPTADDLARVLILDENQKVIAETETNTIGQWVVDAPDDAAGVLAHSFKNSLLARYAPITQAATMGLPSGHTCTITCAGAPDVASYAFHPVSLNGLPDDKTALLRDRADGTLRSDVASWLCEAEPRELTLQDGRYSLSGGLMSMSELAAPGITLSAVSLNGRVIVPDAFGAYEVEVTEPLDLRLTFKQLESIR
ncbi:MAG: hypothetical protein AAF999_13770 [Pseudomonadota bacterium]